MNVLGIIESSEEKLLRNLKHPHIVSFIGVKEVDNIQYMIMEYMNRGVLLTYIHENEVKTYELFRFAENICSGMIYLQAENNS